MATYRSGSTLAQVMVCCLTAPSHYLNQCWLIITKVQGYLAEGNFPRDTLSSITTIGLKINYLKFHIHLPGTNELKLNVKIKCHCHYKCAWNFVLFCFSYVCNYERVLWLSFAHIQQGCFICKRVCMIATVVITGNLSCNITMAW